MKVNVNINVNGRSAGEGYPTASDEKPEWESGNIKLHLVLHVR